MRRSIPLDLLHDFGGQGPVIHLAHANVFPPAAYSPFAGTLIGSGQSYNVIGLPARPLWPDSRPEGAPTWHTLADDLIKGLDAMGLTRIVGVGHSMGGVCTMWAAIRRPDLFRTLVLINPVILPPSWLRVLALMRRLGLRQRQPLVKGALRRRRTWPGRQACYERYRGKPLFAHWPDHSLRAYVEAGTRPRADGHVELLYPPEWEAHIFATSPTDVWRYVPKLNVLMRLQCWSSGASTRILSSPRVKSAWSTSFPRHAFTSSLTQGTWCRWNAPPRQARLSGNSCLE